MFPFPATTLRRFFARSMSARFRLINSDARRPVSSNNKIIARSRSLFRADPGQQRLDFDFRKRLDDKLLRARLFDQAQNVLFDIFMFERPRPKRRKSNVIVQDGFRRMRLGSKEGINLGRRDALDRGVADTCFMKSFSVRS